MAKTKTVKWSIGADEPEDLQEFLSNDDIVLKHTPKKGPNKGETAWPGKGPFRFQVVFMKVKPNKNGDDRISVLLRFAEPKDSDAASWNGYGVFDGFNVVDGPGLSFLKRYLKALGLSWSDFVSKTKQNDEDPPQIVQIAGTKFGTGASKPVYVQATVKVEDADDWNDDDHLVIGRYIPAEDASDGEDASDDSAEDSEATDVMSMDSTDDSDASDGDAWDRDDFDDDDFDAVVAVAKEDFNLTAKDIKPFKKTEDKEGLLGLMFGASDDDSDDSDEVEELRAELQDLKVGALRKRLLASDEDADVEGVKKDALIDLILQAELNLPPF